MHYLHSTQVQLVNSGFFLVKAQLNQHRLSAFFLSTLFLLIIPPYPSIILSFENKQKKKCTTVRTQLVAYELEFFDGRLGWGAGW